MDSFYLSLNTGLWGISDQTLFQSNIRGFFSSKGGLEAMVQYIFTTIQI